LGAISASGVDFMTKADFAAKIADKLSMTRNESAELTDQLFELMKQVIVEEGKLKIAGFGNFEVKRKQDRKGRNPQTGEEMTITARSILSYHPSVILKKRINGISKSE
jgi:integration host factor subunit alpha